MYYAYFIMHNIILCITIMQMQLFCYTTLINSRRMLFFTRVKLDTNENNFKLTAEYLHSRGEDIIRGLGVAHINTQSSTICLLQQTLSETIINLEHATLAVSERKDWRTYLTVRHNKVVYEGKHLLPGTYFKRFIANDGASRGTSLLTHYERREILFMSFAFIPLCAFAPRRHLRLLETFVKKKIQTLNWVNGPLNENW